MKSAPCSGSDRAAAAFRSSGGTKAPPARGKSPGSPGVTSFECKINGQSMVDGARYARCYRFAIARVGSEGVRTRAP